MAYFVTGATGFIGRFLLAELLKREGTIYALCRAGSLDKLDELSQRLGAPEGRIVPVVGDLSRERLGVDAEQIERLDGQIEHFFHLAAIYDLTADAASQRTANVEGTRHAVQLAEAFNAGHFHQVSSIAAAGLYKGTFTEDMFDEAVDVEHNPYYLTKHESEAVVRNECSVPWRVYRPGAVVGHSKTGEIDKIDGPYYFFRSIQRLRGAVPSWVRLIGVEGGEINMVPVDYVAEAMDFLAHQPGLDGQAFHLTDPEPPTVGGLVKTLTQGGRRAEPRGQRRRAGPRRAADPRRRPAGRPARRQADQRPRARRTRRAARGVRLPDLPDALRLHEDPAGARRLGYRGAAVRDLRADAVGVLGAHVQPGPPQGPCAGQGDQGQDRHDHRRVLGHRQGHRTAGRRGRRAGHPRRPRRRCRSSRPARRSPTSAAWRSCTAATCRT